MGVEDAVAPVDHLCVEDGGVAELPEVDELGLVEPRVREQAREGICGGIVVSVELEVQVGVGAPLQSQVREVVLRQRDRVDVGVVGLAHVSRGSDVVGELVRRQECAEVPQNGGDGSQNATVSVRVVEGERACSGPRNGPEPARARLWEGADAPGFVVAPVAVQESRVLGVGPNVRHVRDVDCLAVQLEVVRARVPVGVGAPNGAKRPIVGGSADLVVIVLVRRVRPGHVGPEHR